MVIGGILQHIEEAGIHSGDSACVLPPLGVSAAALDTIASKPVDGYEGWADIAKKGAEAARADDMDGVKAACKSCHGKFQKKYRADAKRCEGW